MTGYEEQDPNDLEHVGVLGMKWGHRKTGTGGQIYAARGRVKRQRSDIANQKIVVNKSSNDVNAHNKQTVKLNEMKSSYLKNPDRVISARMTNGEKVVAFFLTGPVALGAIAGTSARSRAIENKQDKIKYN